MFFVNEEIPQKWLQMSCGFGYQKYRFDVKDGEAFNVLKKIGDLIVKTPKKTLFLWACFGLALFWFTRANRTQSILLLIVFS